MNKEFLNRLGGFDETSRVVSRNERYDAYDVIIRTTLIDKKAHQLQISFHERVVDKMFDGIDGAKKIQWTKLFGNDVIYFVPDNNGHTLSDNSSSKYKTHRLKTVTKIDIVTRDKIEDYLSGGYDVHYDQYNNAYYIKVCERKKFKK